MMHYLMCFTPRSDEEGMVTMTGLGNVVVLYLNLSSDLTNVNSVKSTCAKITLNLQVQFMLLCNLWWLLLVGTWLALLGGCATWGFALYGVVSPVQRGLVNVLQAWNQGAAPNLTAWQSNLKVNRNGTSAEWCS